VIGRIFGTLAALLGAVIVAVLVMFIFVAKHYRLPSSSMEATLHCARPSSGCRGNDTDRLIAFTFLDYGRGDIVAMKTPPLAEERCGAGGIFIKRIVGLPGETLAEKRGFIYVNGKKIDEPYVEPELRDFQDYAARKIPPGHYFMLGDNRQASCDSRVWGPLPKRNIVGKVFAVWWPVSRIRFP
jgi:signal peptidase I